MASPRWKACPSTCRHQRRYRVVVEKQEKQYRFGTFGPFELPLSSRGLVARNELDTFWSAVEAEHPGLAEAMGCYIFSIQLGSSILPWYVGKTEKKTFKFEAVQPHKILHYQDALNEQTGGTALLFLLPRLTDAGKFRKVWKSGSSSVARLEGLLIGTALDRNPKLRNRMMMKHLTQSVVPGYMNDSSTDKSSSARKLSAMFGRGDSSSSLSSAASSFLIRTMTDLEEELGASFGRKNRVVSVFTFDGLDYRVTLEPYIEEAKRTSVKKRVRQIS